MKPLFKCRFICRSVSTGTVAIAENTTNMVSMILRSQQRGSSRLSHPRRRNQALHRTSEAIATLKSRNMAWSAVNTIIPS